MIFTSTKHQCDNNVSIGLKNAYIAHDQADEDLEYFRACQRLIQNYARDYPKSRTAAAWRLSNLKLDRAELITAVHKASFERSGLFKMSQAYGGQRFFLRAHYKKKQVRVQSMISSIRNPAHVWQ